MLVLQLGLYWAGIGLFAFWALKRGRPALAVAFACVGWLPAPLALAGTVTKDFLMTGCLTCSAGLVLWRDVATTRAAKLNLSIGAIFMLTVAAALRLNAILACLPLALAAVPRRFTKTKLRIIATGLCATFALAMVGPVINALVHAEKTGVELSLIIFDLGGITEHSGISQFPDMQVSNPVAINHRCYDPLQWDSYSSWAKRPCPLGFDRFQSAVEDHDLHPMRMWLRAIVTHPIAYAEHRLTHFNLSTWFLVPRGPKFTAWSQSVPNPIFWISVGLAALILAFAAGLRSEVLAITASAPLYGLGYLLVGVATGMRYHLWTISGAALGAVLVVGELFFTAVPPRALRLAAAFIAIPTLIAIISRIPR